MTLQEAIDHALEKAKELGSCECANEHLQLAGWLKELQDIKAKKEAAYSPWRDPKKELPKDGEKVLIREYFRSARHGRFVNHVREMWYFEQYGFKLEEDCNRHLGYRITHWMPIPDVPNK